VFELVCFFLNRTAEIIDFQPIFKPAFHVSKTLVIRAWLASGVRPAENPVNRSEIKTPKVERLAAGIIVCAK